MWQLVHHHQYKQWYIYSEEQNRPLGNKDQLQQLIIATLSKQNDLQLSAFLPKLSSLRLDRLQDMTFQISFHWEVRHALATCTWSGGQNLLVSCVGNIQLELPLKMHSCKHPHNSTLQACMHTA